MGKIQQQDWPQHWTAAGGAALAVSVTALVDSTKSMQTAQSSTADVTHEQRQKQYGGTHRNFSRQHYSHIIAKALLIVAGTSRRVLPRAARPTNLPDKGHELAPLVLWLSGKSTPHSHT